MISHEQRAISLKYLAQLGISTQRIADILGFQHCQDGCLTVGNNEVLQDKCDMLVATQSLLLSVYTPESMKAWFQTPRIALYGKTPLQHLENGVSPIKDVLIEAHRTIM